MAVDYVWSYPLGKSVLGAVALLHPGIDALEMMSGDVVLQRGAGTYFPLETLHIFVFTDSIAVSLESKNDKQIAIPQYLLFAFFQKLVSVKLFTVAKTFYVFRAIKALTTFKPRPSRELSF